MESFLQFTQPMRHGRRTTICREGWYYVSLTAAILVWASLREANLLVIIGGLLCGPFVLSWFWGSLALRRIEIRRSISTAVQAGNWLTVDIQVRNTARRLGLWALVVQDRIQPQLTGQPAELLRPDLFFPHLRAGESARQGYRVRLPQRGRYSLGPIVAWTRFPFGLFRHRIVVECPGELVVLPRLGRLQREARPEHIRVLEGSRSAKCPSRGPGDFFAVRDWQTGDSPRWVHWRSTARQGRLMVRQFEQPAERDLALLLDLRLPGLPTAEQIENVELAVSYAATVVHELCRHRNARLFLAIAASEPVCLAGLVSPPLHREAMEKLAVAQPPDEDRLPALLAAVQERLAAGAEVLLVSTRDDHVAEAPLYASLKAARGARGAAGRIRSICTSEPEFSESFVVEPLPNT